MAAKDGKKATDEQPGQAVQSPFEGLALPMVEHRDPDEVQRDILQRMTQAQSWDELLTVHSGDSGKLKVGECHRFDEVGFDTFEAPDGELVPIAHVKTWNLDTNERESWRTASRNITGALAVASSRGWLPVTARIGQVKTRSGNDVQYLEPI